MPEVLNRLAAEPTVADLRSSWPNRRLPRWRCQRTPLVPRFEPLEERALLAVAPLGDEFQVDTFSTGDQQTSGNQAVAMDAAGNFVVVWQSQGQDGDGWGVYGQRFDADGQRLGDEFRVNTTGVGDQTSPAVAMNASGQFLVAWNDSRTASPGVYLQRFNADGSALGSQTRALDPGQPNDGLNVGINGGGEFFVAVTSHNGASTVARFRADGVEDARFLSYYPIGPLGWVQNASLDDEGRLYTSGVDSRGPHPIITAGTWSLELTSRGNPPVGWDLPEMTFSVNASGAQATAFAGATSADQAILKQQLGVVFLPSGLHSADIAADPVGRSVAVWDGPVIQAFDVFGNPSSEIIRAADVPVSPSALSVATFGGDSAVVVWSSADGFALGVQARRFRVTVPADVTPPVVTGVYGRVQPSQSLEARTTPTARPPLWCPSLRRFRAPAALLGRRVC